MWARSDLLSDPFVAFISLNVFFAQGAFQHSYISKGIAMHCNALQCIAAYAGPGMQGVKFGNIDQIKFSRFFFLGSLTI